MTCACLGPQNGEPLCPCLMRAARQHLGVQQYAPMPFQQGAVVVSPVHGCVCPVGAEKTCRGLACPRREIRIT